MGCEDSFCEIDEQVPSSLSVGSGRAPPGEKWRETTISSLASQSLNSSCRLFNMLWLVRLGGKPLRNAVIEIETVLPKFVYIYENELIVSSGKPLGFLDSIRSM